MQLNSVFTQNRKRIYTLFTEKRTIKNKICDLQLPREPYRSTRLLKLTGRRGKVISIKHRQVDFLIQKRGQYTI